MKGFKQTNSASPFSLYLVAQAIAVNVSAMFLLQSEVKIWNKMKSVTLYNKVH